MKPMPRDPMSSESDSLAPFDARFYGKINVVIGLLIGVLAAIVITAGTIIYIQVGIGRRIVILEDQVGISQKQTKKLADFGAWMNGVDTRLGEVDDQLKSVDNQLVSLGDQVKKNVDISNSNKDIANENAANVTKNTDAINDLGTRFDELSP